MNWVLEGLSLVGVPQSATGWMVVMADVVVKGTVILGAAAAITLGMRGASAALRHHVWGVALGSLLLLPLLSIVMPRWHVSFLPSVSELGLLQEPVVVEFAEPVVAVSPESPVVIVLPAEPVVVVVPNSETPMIIALPSGSGANEVTPQPVRERAATGSASIVNLGADAAANWPTWALAVWSVGAALVVALLGIGLLRVWSIARRAKPVTDPELLGLVEEITHDLNIQRPVRLLESHTSITPMTWGLRNPVVLLPQDANGWSTVRLRDVLLHEFAHVKRYDYLTQLLSRYACAVYWFNPVVWLAAKQLRLERERACDDAVLNAGAKPTEYANHLLQIARSLKASQATVFATVAMARPSQLTGRLLDVLDETRSRRTVSGSASTMTWALAAAIVFPLAAIRPAESEGPATSGELAQVVAPIRIELPLAIDLPRGTATLDRPMTTFLQDRQCDGARDGDRQGTQSNSNDDRHTIRWWDGDCEGEVRIRGEVDFNEDFTDIVRLARGGSFSIELDDGRTIREVEITADRGGRLERRWLVNRREMDYSDGAEAWLADALQEFFRRSSYMLDERVAWILDTRGVQGLLEEASLAYSGYLRARYYSKAIQSGQLSAPQVQQILALAQREIDSDYELSGLLRSVPADYLQDQGVRQAYVQASNSLESDYEMGRVLAAILMQEGLSDELVLSLFRSAQELESDYELAKLLIGIAPRYLHNDRLRSAYISNADDIQSDYEHTRVLFALFEQPNLNSQILLQLLESATNIDSDYELSRLLQRTASNYVVDEALRVAFFDAVNSVGSDFEHRKILSALLGNTQLAPLVVRDVLQSAMAIDSDFELGNILRETAGTYVMDDTLRPLFFQAVETVDSDYERRRVLTSVAERREATKAVILDVIAAARTIGSDHEKASLLMTLGQRHRGDEQLREAMMDVADTLDSDYEHGRVMRMLRGRAGAN